ncbi:unnamed protein product [Rodentolepis nana]|uniref:Uncharacterized protein n=1 Tax=Rodentolepis nana TaxID=102285 RepID=A0A0R3TWU0_RODNA|nr:unnamed protein product [Rodentolepis nana]
MQSIFEEATRDNASQQSEPRSDEFDHQESSSKTQSPPDPTHQQIVSRSFSQSPGDFPPLSGTSSFTSTLQNPPFIPRPEDSILFIVGGGGGGGGYCGGSMLGPWFNSIPARNVRD